MKRGFAKLIRTKQCNFVSIDAMDDVEAIFTVLIWRTQWVKADV